MILLHLYFSTIISLHLKSRIKLSFYNTYIMELVNYLDLILRI